MIKEAGGHARRRGPCGETRRLEREVSTVGVFAPVSSAQLRLFFFFFFYAQVGRWSPIKGQGLFPSPRAIQSASRAVFVTSLSAVWIGPLAFFTYLFIYF